ncbi:hypothetical protein QR680_002779 [Steinernema hermaphroditum]|uniref:Uncharacterized protein n=1 Tax=Steinernema hermaphroditum TaxID=289476 RepID=A0AA39H445_9BILA|nr:hypothetical protein QR680_002779 [Steinernema hermaphroditum]
MGEVAELWPNLPGAELRPHFVRYKKPIHGHAAESDLRVLRELFKGGECSRLRPLRAPVLPIRSSANLSEPIAFINSGEKPLAAYIFTRSETSVNSFCRETSSAGVAVNDDAHHS